MWAHAYHVCAHTHSFNTHYLLSLSFFRYSRTLVGLISPRVVARAFLNSALTASMTTAGISVFSYTMPGLRMPLLVSE